MQVVTIRLRVMGMVEEGMEKYAGGWTNEVERKRKQRTTEGRKSKGGNDGKEGLKINPFLTTTGTSRPG